MDSFHLSTGNIDLNWSLDTNQGTSGLLAAVLPYARSVTVGSAATAFGVMINNSSTAATACSLQMPSGIAAPSVFQFRATTPTNTIDQNFRINQPVDIPANGSKNFVFGVTPTAAFSADIPLIFDCENKVPVVSQSGLNTFLLSASATATPDMVAIGATPTNDGISSIPGNTGTTFFAAAVVNIGSAGAITVNVDDGGRGLAAGALVCQSDPLTAACINPAAPASSVSFNSTTNQVATFTIQVTGTGNVPVRPGQQPPVPAL